jgi:hypothetical protein
LEGNKYLILIRLVFIADTNVKCDIIYISSDAVLTPENESSWDSSEEDYGV